MRLWLRLSVVTLTIATTLGLGAWAHAQAQQSPDEKILSGSEVGFRVDPVRTQVEGKLAGTWVVRVNGRWMEPLSAASTRRLAAR